MQVESTPVAVTSIPIVGNVDTSTLFKQHAQFVAGFLSRLGVDAADVGDVVQEVFVVVHRKGGYQKGPARPTTWLAEIAVRVAASYRRRRAKQDRAAPAEPSIDDAGFGSLDEAQMFARVEQALAELPENERVVFVLDTSISMQIKDPPPPPDENGEGKGGSGRGTTRVKKKVKKPGETYEIPDSRMRLRRVQRELLRLIDRLIACPTTQSWKKSTARSTTPTSRRS